MDNQTDKILRDRNAWQYHQNIKEEGFELKKQVQPNLSSALQ